MVTQYSDATKLEHAKTIAKEGGCFVVERSDGNGGMKFWLLYRETIATQRNAYIGRRASISGLLALVKKAVQSV